jgi:hypothetical protein
VATLAGAQRAAPAEDPRGDARPMSESVRELLGIAHSETCGCDTMPSERTGCCFFCDTSLVRQGSKPARGAASPKPAPKAARRRSPRGRYLYGTYAHGHVLSDETAFIVEDRLRSAVSRRRSATGSSAPTRVGPSTSNQGAHRDQLTGARALASPNACLLRLTVICSGNLSA